MARKFRKKPGLGILSLPGMAGLGNDEIIEGDEYARFCPAVLEEVFDSPDSKKPEKEKVKGPPVPPSKVVPEPPSKPVKEDKPKPIKEDKPKPIKSDKPKSAKPEIVEEAQEEEEVEPPNINWLKSELTEYAEGLGLIIDKTMTKSQILAAIEEEEAAG